jgi:P4 family phage/plasmid primase-like protien
MTSKDDAKKIKLKIDELLNENRTAKGMSDFTHVSMGGITFPGKFNFSDSNKRDKLAKYLAQANENGVIFSIAEKLQNYAPIMIDIDLRYPKDSVKTDFEDMDHLYDDNMIINIVDYYKEAIKNYLNVSDNELQCFIFEKEKYGYKSGEASDGIHMIFPYIVANNKVRHLIFKYVNDKVTDEETFSMYSNFSSVLDDKIITTNPWLMYGCAKPNGEPYKLTRIFDVENDEIELGTVGKNVDIIKLLSMRDKRWDEDNATPYDDDYDEDKINELYTEHFSYGGDKDDPTDMYELIPDDKLDLIDKAMKMTELLSSKRADNYFEWLRVGWALHNTHRCLIDTWVQFSKRSRKFCDGECEKLWASMKDDGYTIRSLMLWAKEDSLEEYKIFIKEDFENNLKKNSVNNTFMIAKALHAKYFDRFVCADIKQNIWYHFTNHRWNKCVNGGKLITLMSSEFANYYIAMSQEYSKQAIDAGGSDKKTFLDQSIHFNKIADSLMDINFKEKVMKEAKYIFHDDQFLNRLDENHHMIGFENGVYDLKLKKFRSGHPDDHISMSTKQQYVKWNDNNPYAKYIKNFFEQVMPIEAVRKYLLTRLSTCLSGENRDEIFIFCIGSGSNGKSLTFQLVSEALGDYYISCPITIITRKRNSSNAASPELARMKGVRCGVYQEPGTDEEINVGIFKELSGNDRFMVRGLYSEPIEIRPQLKQFMTTNELPEIKSIDGGTWRRIRVIDFMSKFVENPDSNNEYEFKLDTSLKDKISQWAPAFVSYLIHIYTTMYDIPNRDPEPAEVKTSTEQYRREQDIFREFSDATIEITHDKKDIIKRRDLATSFKIWHKEAHEGAQLPKIKALNDYFEKMLKIKSNSSGFIGIKYKKEAHNQTHSGDEMMEEVDDLDK